MLRNILASFCCVVFSVSYMNKCRETTRLKAELASSKEKNARQTQEKKDRQGEYVQYISGSLMEYLKLRERETELSNALMCVVELAYNQTLAPEEKIEEIRKSLNCYLDLAESKEKSPIINVLDEIMKILDKGDSVKDNMNEIRLLILTIPNPTKSLAFLD